MTVTAVKASGQGRTIDTNALRFNQAMIVFWTVLAFILGTGRGGSWIVLLVGLSLAIGAAMPGFGPFQIIYRKIVTQVGLLKPVRVAGSPAPHRFAQAMGGTCLLLSAAFLAAGWTLAGWALAWIVVALATVNLVFGFCAGCFIYLQLDRFRQSRSAVA